MNLSAAAWTALSIPDRCLAYARCKLVYTRMRANLRFQEVRAEVRRSEACITCRYTDCAEVCPADYFLEGPELSGSQSASAHQLRGARARMPGECGPQERRHAQ